MPMIVKRVLFWIWPPYEAKVADREIETKRSETRENARWNSLVNGVRAALPKDATKYAELEIVAKLIQEAESKRKDTLEKKASTFVSGIGVGVGVISVVPALFSNYWLIPVGWAFVAGVAYLLAIIVLLVAAYYAVQVRQVAGVASPCADSFLDLLKEHQGKIDERIALTIAQVKWNEDLLLQKSNYLSVAEGLFLRGLALVAFAAVLSVAAKLFVN